MCKCTPEIRTPFCGKPGCQWPKQKSKYMGFRSVNEPIQEFEDDVEAFMWQEKFKNIDCYLIQRVVLKIQVS